MPLFDVPGWTVDAPPIAEAVKTSKKRKRSAVEPHNLKAAEANFEKLIKQLERSSTDNSSTTPKKKEKKEKKEKKKRVDTVVNSEKVQKQQVKKVKKDTAEKQTPAQPPLKTLDQSHPSSPRSKKTKERHARESSYSQSAITGLTPLQKGMKESLDGARFRIINESLYKSDSSQAHKMMKADPRVFEDYHAGFRHQVQSWPTNPVEHYISVLSTYPRDTIIADLGCGDAAMARALIPKGLSIISFDLVSDGAFVVEADICSKIPLPGSEPMREKSEGEGHLVDVVVCALSLMGTNWPNCLREAWRILKPSGELKIAEVASRFNDVEKFQKLVGSIGFRLDSKDATNSHFTLFEFRKVASQGKSEEEWGRNCPSFDDQRLALRSSERRMKGINKISFILGIEATRTLEQSSFEGRTPVGPFTGTTVKPRIGLTPILRAGLGMTDALVCSSLKPKIKNRDILPMHDQLSLFPNAPVYHLGLFREKVTLQPVEYYSKLPSSPPVDQVFLLDPLIATGGTACAALTMIVDWGIPVKDIKLLCVLASSQGLAHVQSEYPDLEAQQCQIWAAGVDQELTPEGFISPGLGDTVGILLTIILTV
ncbi:hypothetical protein C0995_013134 [Termitomyces sp. Mi166|nr:hypothetical protein C0995_013134 [Termitomyces sp. Mi166\